MKGKLVRLSKLMLTGCMALGVWVGCDIASLIFFGEYEYPSAQ